MRVLSVKLGENHAAACAVWEVISAEDLFREILARGGTSPPTKRIFEGDLDELGPKLGDLGMGHEVRVWGMRPEDHARALALDYVDCPYEEYLQRISDAETALGRRLTVVDCSVSDIEREISRGAKGVAEAILFQTVFRDPISPRTLRGLAMKHAKNRWNKKRRNADLRASGYDPDGKDGKEYRDIFLSLIGNRDE